MKNATEVACTGCLAPCVSTRSGESLSSNATFTRDAHLFLQRVLSAKYVRRGGSRDLQPDFAARRSYRTHARTTSPERLDCERRVRHLSLAMELGASAIHRH